MLDDVMVSWKILDNWMIFVFPLMSSYLPCWRCFGTLRPGRFCADAIICSCDVNLAWHHWSASSGSGYTSLNFQLCAEMRGTSNEPNTWKAIKTCFFFDLFLAFCSLMSFCRGARLDERPMPRFSFKAETCPNSWALAIAQHLPIKLVFGLMAIWCNLHQLHHPAVPHPARPPGHVWKLQFVPGSIEVATDATPSPAKLVQLVIKMDETTCWIHHGPSDPDFRFPSPILLDVARLRPHRACLNSMVERIKCALNTDERCCGLKAD